MYLTLAHLGAGTVHARFPLVTELCGRAGLDLAGLEATTTADPDRFETVLAENDQSLRAAGHWGVPTTVFEGEPFFGQDRFDMLLWRLKQRGPEPRRPVPSA